MALVAGSGALLIALLVRLVASRCRRFGGMAVQASAALSQRTLEALAAMRIIRLFGRETYEQKRYDRASGEKRLAWLRIEVATALVPPMSEILHTVLFLGVLLFAWQAAISVAIILAFLLLLYRLQPYARRLDEYRAELAALLPAIAEVAKLLDPRDKPVIRSGSRPFPGLREAISFDDVSFRYEGATHGRDAVTGLSCEIRRNQATAIVGDLGAGKSTMVSLLCRLYVPTAGSIRVDGVPLQELDLTAWRRRIAFAGQDVELMDETVLDNIAYGRPGADRVAVVMAAREADAHGFITSLPQGYDTLVGERGLGLSAGQRQRIGLARALIREPDILILDEATNALDSVSENAIQGALERLAGRLTMIVIAHRLSTIRHADHVIVLSQGRLVEQGRPSSS